MRWAAEQRQNFIRQRLAGGLTVNRSDLVETFKISEPQASNDLTVFRRGNPDAIAYDATRKAYVGTNTAMPATHHTATDGDGLVARLEALGAGLRIRWRMHADVRAEELPETFNSVNEAATTIEALRSEVERLTTLLDGRDAFIVRSGLWGAFVDSLPQSPPFPTADNLRSRAEAAERTLAEALKALEPFADACQHLHPALPDNGETLDGFKVKDFRLAAAVRHKLTAQEPASSPWEGVK